MKRVLTLALFPLLGAAFIAIALLWNERELRLRFAGERADGLIVGMALQRDGAADLLTGLDSTIVLGLADGTRFTAIYRNYAPVAGSHQSSSDAPAQAVGIPDFILGDGTRQDADLSAESRRVLADAVRGDAAIIRWALLRESRRPLDSRRVVRIEKTETIRGYFDVTDLPDVMGIRDGELLLNENGTAAASAGVARIHAVFDRSDVPSVLRNKGETLVQYTYERNGVTIEPAKRDFFLAGEPYATEFRPVFAFKVGDEAVARLSHIGRHGGPTLALRLYTSCTVYFDPQNPADAIVVANPGPAEGLWLNWFSRVCEGLFSQWGSGALIVIAGGLFIFVGLILISLALWPNRQLSAQGQGTRIASSR